MDDTYEQIDRAEVLNQKEKLAIGSKNYYTAVTANAVSDKSKSKGCNFSKMIKIVSLLALFLFIGGVIAGGVVAAMEIGYLKERARALGDKIDQLNTSIMSSTLKNAVKMVEGAPPNSSCASLPSSSPSGYYWLTAPNGSAVRVYCDMTRSCGSVTGGWMRVAFLDMNNSSQQCPDGLRLCTDSGIRLCAISDFDASCSSVSYDSKGLPYSKVCGMVIGYPSGTIDAFRGTHASIDTIYLDGVSLTHGSNPRHHIWSFGASDGSCRCGSRPTFAGDNFFCDGRQGGRLIENPIWDGRNCNDLACCIRNNPPWFFRQLPQSTNDNIEMRVCRDEPRNSEDLSIGAVEIYVQ